MNYLSRNAISLKKLQAIVLPAKVASTSPDGGQERASALQANMMTLGYMLDQEAFRAVSMLEEYQISQLADRIIAAIQEMKGADVVYNPMYPNFPLQVMEASDLELFANALIHYWSYGTLYPVTEVAERPFEFEETKFTTITLASTEDFMQIVPTILSSADSISEDDKAIVLSILDNEKNVPIPVEIPFAENRTWFGAALFDRGVHDLSFIKTTSDVLRFATALSGGDVSLSENTRFRNFRRPERRAMCNALERVAKLEDFARHRGKWTRLFHALHVGDYSEDLWEMAKKVRNNEHIETFNGRVEAAIASNNALEAASLLKTRPGEFARRILTLLSLKGLTKNRLLVIEEFADVVDKVPTRNLLQLRGAVHQRGRGEVNLRVAFPKGAVQRAIAIRDKRDRLAPSVFKDLSQTIDRSLLRRFGELNTLGKVYIDPALDYSPLPTQQRSASTSEWTVARGTQLPIADDGKDTLRFFIYWVGLDIDLSCTFHDENFEEVGHVSYTNLRERGLATYHSGDITRAPNGAAEFIDVDMLAAAQSARYVAMNVYVFNGPTFDQHKTVYAGWMTRSKPNSNEVFDPKTVQQKLDLTAQSRRAMPVVFDLVERRAIWVDLMPSYRSHFWGNNTESNRASAEEIMMSMVNATDSRTSLWDLFALHATARGEIVDSREEADVTFGFERGVDVTPYDINAINADYVIG
jgi:hypothetical protein